MSLIVLISAASAQTTSGWQLVWNDEFNGTAGSPPDATKWNYDIGVGNPVGWGNHEAETYTSSTQNAFQDGNGNLIIRAIRDSSGNYTSARLQSGSPGASTHTADNNWQYGMVIARIKIPFGQGVWPAFWMLGENIGTIGWPFCGEIDIMENFGTFNNSISTNNGTAHGPVDASYNDYSAGGKYTLPFGEKVADDYHLYAIQWSEDSVAFYVDGKLYYTATPSQVPAGKWVFNNPYFILLNLAIGGPSTFLGTPDPNAPFANQDMLVDYVRVYQTTPATATTPVITPGQVVNAASYLGDLAPGGLATVYGSNLADAEHLITASPNFPASAAGVSVSVNGVPAPLIYVSPTQINFQIPWATAPGTSIPIIVTRDSVASAPEQVTIAAPAAPSMFLSEFVNGVAWVTGTGCVLTECAVQPGAIYQLWANGLGPKNGPSQDGVGAVYSGSITPLEVPGSPASCQLTIGGQTADVQYCGAAPFEIIDQINFVYPTGVTATTPYVDASLTIGGATGRFRVPAPASSDQLAQQLLAQMTQAEKLQLVHGAGGPVTNIIPLPRRGGRLYPRDSAARHSGSLLRRWQRGRGEFAALPSTALPSSIASAATWDLNLAYQYGTVIGAEMSQRGLNVNLGGKRQPDRPRAARRPHLRDQGRRSDSGRQDHRRPHPRQSRTSTSIGGIKHYALNDQETGRTTEQRDIDERAGARATCWRSRSAAADSDVQSVMCSYNLVNGTWSCENPHLLNEVLKATGVFRVS